MSRFYHPAGFADSSSGEPVGSVSLEPDEAHHAARVLRLQVDAAVELFDGKGDAVTGRIARVDKKGVDVEILEPVPATRLTGPVITILAAMPKGDRLRWLVEKATELGVHRLIPLRSERSVVQGGSGKVEKMEQVVIAACKQCQRNDLMTITTPVDWSSFWKSPPPATASHRPGNSSGETTCFLAHPGGLPISESLSRLPAGSSPQEVFWLIGPEGGFSPSEVAEAQSHGTQLVSLGPQILRIETAVLMVAAVTATLGRSSN